MGTARSSIPPSCRKVSSIEIQKGEQKTGCLMDKRITPASVASTKPNGDLGTISGLTASVRFWDWLWLCIWTSGQPVQLGELFRTGCEEAVVQTKS